MGHAMSKGETEGRDVGVISRMDGRTKPLKKEEEEEKVEKGEEGGQEKKK